MKVLLTKSVPHLGLPGDMRIVKDGYARNYLIPHGLAVLSSDPMAKQLLAELGTARSVAEQDKTKTQESVKQWEGKQVKLTVKANPDGTLFGAVTNKDIATSLGVDAKQINFETTKVSGEFEAVLDLGFGVTVQIPVMIVAEGKQRVKRS